MTRQERTKKLEAERKTDDGIVRWRQSVTMEGSFTRPPWADRPLGEEDAWLCVLVAGSPGIESGRDKRESG